MFIKQIVDYDKTSGEMDLIVSDGKYELLCYCACAQNSNLRSPNIEKVQTFLADSIMRTPTHSFLVEKTSDGFYSYRLQGRVLKIDPPIIEIGKIPLVIDTPFPKDIIINEYVELFAKRIDCFVY